MSRFIEELAAKVVVSKSVLALPARLKRARSKQNVQGGKVQKPLEKNGIEVRGNSTTPNPEDSRANWIWLNPVRSATNVLYNVARALKMAGGGIASSSPLKARPANGSSFVVKKMFQKCSNFR